MVDESQHRSKLLEKSLPSNEESERVILGSIILDNAIIAQVINVLVSEDFYSPLNRRVYAAMCALFDASKPIDPIMIGEELKKEGALESIGGISSITNLIHGLPHFSNVDEYMKVVKDDSLLRHLIRTCNSITSEALAEDEDACVVLDRAETLIYSLYDAGNQSTATRMDAEVTTAIATAHERADAGSVVVGIPTGFSQLDSKLQGYRRGQYIVTAARPSVGKTSIALRRLYHATVEHGAPALLFSLEMSKTEIADRIICAEGNIDSYALRAGQLTQSEWEKAEEIRTRLQAAEFFINDDPAATTRTIRTELRRLNSLLRKKGKKIELVVVDHIGLMRNALEKRGRTREGEVSEISKELKAIAREEKCALNALSQLNRGSENRTDHTPMISDLRESGSIEQDADVVELLYREDVYQTDPLLYTNIAEVIIGKNRNGPTGRIKLHFTRKSTRFSDLSQAFEQPQASYQPGDIIL